MIKILKNKTLTSYWALFTFYFQALVGKIDIPVAFRKLPCILARSHAETKESYLSTYMGKY
jgi:hypothetical protein